MPEQTIDDEISLRDYWRVLMRRRRLVFGITGLAAAMTVVIMLLLPNVYRSQATLLPLGEGSRGLQGALGDLGGLLPLGALRRESPTERLMAILQSRTLAEDVIRRLDLLPQLFADDWDAATQQWRTDEPPTMHDALRRLDGMVSVTSDKTTGEITIAVEYTDPELAATIANQYIAALQRILNDNAFSLAKKHRLFIEVQVQQTRQELAAAEEALRQFEQQHQIIALDAQADAAVQTIAGLESQIIAKEVQLGVLQRTVTGASQEVTLLREELQGLRTQLARLQRSQAATAPPASGHNDAEASLQVFPPIADTPEIKLQYARLQRQAEIQNKLFILLMQQLEQAKLDEARDETAFQVLDGAVPPDRKVKPRRGLSVVLATVVGLFVGVFAAFVRDYADSTIRGREQVERQTGLPVLATVPAAAQRRRRRPRRPAAGALPQPSSGTPEVEAYRYLYTRLRRHQNGGKGGTVLLVGLTRRDDIATVLVNLGAVAAHAGEKTLLIDGNLRQPQLHQRLACPLAPGLAELLRDPPSWPKGVQPTTVENLYLLPAGAGSADSSAWFESAAFATVLAQCQDAYERIFLTVAPLEAGADAMVLASRVETTCLLLTGGVSRLEAVVEAREALEAVQARVAGALLVDGRA
jgi:tyrosine-protein kinase Etk/Wzc